MDFEDVSGNDCMKMVKNGWTEKHSNLCENLIKGHLFFEKLWELEHGPKS